MPDQNLLICDLTQSWSATGGGGISTYMREKQRYVRARGDCRLLQIVPGAQDRVTIDGPIIFAEVKAGALPHNPNYRFAIRTHRVAEYLARFRPDIIESTCPWLFPWAAIYHQRRFPDTALVAGYRTDFPNVHLYRKVQPVLGSLVASATRALGLQYARQTYRHFDHIYCLNRESEALLTSLGLPSVSQLPLGVDLNQFSPAHRDPALRQRFGLTGDGPLLVYAGRIDQEKRAPKLIDMFRHLPSTLGAALLMIGDGGERARLEQECAGLPVHFTGFVDDRAALATMLASGDIYVSAMADETFGISIIEAQASGLPIVGVRGGAMGERVPAGTGLLAEIDDVAAMAQHVVDIWARDPRTMGNAGRAHVEARFSWERTFEAMWHGPYRTALSNRDRRRGIASPLQLLDVPQ